MGEFADDHLDQMFDDYDRDYDDVDEFGSFGSYIRRGFTPQPQTCRRCHLGGLFWTELPQGWRLVYPGEDEEPHVCKPTVHFEPLPPEDDA